LAEILKKKYKTPLFFFKKEKKKKVKEV